MDGAGTDAAEGGLGTKLGPIQDASVAFTDGRVSYLGPSAGAPDSADCSRVVDGRGCVGLPGKPTALTLLKDRARNVSGALPVQVWWTATPTRCGRELESWSSPVG